MNQMGEGSHPYIGRLPGKGRRIMGDGGWGNSFMRAGGKLLPLRGTAGEQGQEGV
jgi:hypothetical protein